MDPGRAQARFWNQEGFQEGPSSLRVVGRGLCTLHPSTDHTQQLIQRKVSLPERKHFVTMWPVLPAKAPKVCDLQT